MPFQFPARVEKTSIRQFTGVKGSPNQVLVVQITSSSGRIMDVSSIVANEVYDYFLGERGTLSLRDGCRKTSTTGFTHNVDAIFMVQLGGVIQYGQIVDGGVAMLGIPGNGYVPYAKLPFDMPKPDAIPKTPATWPAGWPTPQDPVSESPSGDPSASPDKQICQNSYIIKSYPVSLTFFMLFGGSLPASQYWFWMIDGFRTFSLVGYYNDYPSWMTLQQQAGSYNYVMGQCRMIQQILVKIGITAEDSFGHLLPVGSYTHKETLSFNDGNYVDVPITLNIVNPSLSASPASMSYEFFEQDTLSISKIINVTNSTPAVCTLICNTAELDQAIPGISSSVTISGSTLSQGQSKPVTLQLTGTNPVAGTYTRNLNVHYAVSPVGTPVYTLQIPVTITVYPVYTGYLQTATGAPWPLTFRMYYNVGSKPLITYNAESSPNWNIYLNRHADGSWTVNYLNNYDGSFVNNYPVIPTFRADGAPSLNTTIVGIGWQAPRTFICYPP